MLVEKMGLPRDALVGKPVAAPRRRIQEQTP